MRRLLIAAFVLAIAMVVALAPPGKPLEAQANCYSETGFCIDNPPFQEYFRVRGGIRILGFPVSRTFVLEGFQVQFFQRVILQLQGNSVQRLNVLDPGIMPMTRANFSTFPGPDPSLAGSAPQVGTPGYAEAVVRFVRDVAPDVAPDGKPVGFFTLFNTTVPVDVAFPGGAPNPDLVTLANLEIWGVPTSRPSPDPNNPNFVYQRFQRGIMHYQGQPGSTLGILVADYLKAVIRNRDLPPDLADDMRGSRFFAQYDSTKPNWVARPGELPNTDMTAAFEPGTGTPPPPPPPPPGQPGTPTATQLPGDMPPTVTIQVDDSTIDPGTKITITVIGTDDKGLKRIEVIGDNTGDKDLDGRLSFDCDNQTQCAHDFSATPTNSGRRTLTARAVDTTDQRTEATLEIRVREGTTGTPTATVTGTVVPTATGTVVPTATGTVVPTATGTKTP
ncbi:MAG TPA: hypothetical protein VEQ11_07925 [Chloroflexota bacterium]|nr:hypothetical protein [Chloroflexota bacterium]